MQLNNFCFYKNEVEWFVDLPEYVEQGGSIGDLQMVEGADKMLDLMSEGNDEVTVTIATETFDAADELILTEKCDPIAGGGYYLMPRFEGSEINLTMWLCQVAEFVFGEMPALLFVRKVSS